AGVDRALASCGRCTNTASQATIKFLIALQTFLLEALDLVLLFFEHASKKGNFLLHLLQLHEELALRRGRDRSPSPGVGAASTLGEGLHRAIARAATFDHFHCLTAQRQAKHQQSQSVTATAHNELLTQFDATVLRPGVLVAASGNRALLAVGNQLQLAGVDALQNQVALNGLGTTLAQSHVVLAGAALVSVAFQDNAVAVGLQVT